MSELKNKMIQQMQLKGYSKNTIATYIECLVCLSKHYQTSPDLLSMDGLSNDGESSDSSLIIYYLNQPPFNLK
jgi:hypothetical protein